MLAAIVAGLPVFVVEIIDAHALAGGGVDEFAAAEIDAAVRCTRLVGREENEIARFELAAQHGAPAELELFIGRARDREAVLLEYILEIAGTVERFRCRSAEFVGGADIPLGRGQQDADLAALQEGRCLRHDGRRLYGRGIRNRCRGTGGRTAALLRRLVECLPGLAVHNAADLYFGIALEIDDGAIRFIAEDAVDAGDGVAGILQLLLEDPDIMAGSTAFQRGRGEDRTGQAEKKTDGQKESTELFHANLPFSVQPCVTWSSP